MKVDRNGVALPENLSCAKAQAKRLRKTLSGRCVISHGQALEYIAAIHGQESWGHLHNLIDTGPDGDGGTTAPEQSTTKDETNHSFIDAIPVDAVPRHYLLDRQHTLLLAPDAEAARDYASRACNRSYEDLTRRGSHHCSATLKKTGRTEWVEGTMLTQGLQNILSRHPEPDEEPIFIADALLNYMDTATPPKSRMAEPAFMVLLTATAQEHRSLQRLLDIAHEFNLHIVLWSDGVSDTELQPFATRCGSIACTPTPEVSGLNGGQRRAFSKQIDRWGFVDARRNYGLNRIALRSLATA